MSYGLTVSQLLVQILIFVEIQITSMNRFIDSEPRMESNFCSVLATFWKIDNVC